MGTIRKVTFLSAIIAGVFAASTALADPIKVGIANFGEHPQLNTAVKGFKKALTAAGYVEGKDVVYSESHTNFDISLVPQMIAKLEAEKPKLIYTITTPVSQVAKKALLGSGIPVVFAAVTDPVEAKLVPSWEAGDKGMTGATDLQDVAAIMVFTKKLLPNASRFGVAYNPGEANDVALLRKFEEAGSGAGFTVVPVGIDNINDIQQRITAFSGKADVIYTPGSNLLQPAIAAVAAAARQISVPVMNVDESAVTNHIVPASFAVNYEQVGENAGKIAAEILKGKAPEDIPPSRPTYEDHRPLISKKALTTFGIALPEALADCNCFVE